MIFYEVRSTFYDSGRVDIHIYPHNGDHLPYFHYDEYQTCDVWHDYFYKLETAKQWYRDLKEQTMNI